MSDACSPPHASLIDCSVPLCDLEGNELEEHPKYELTGEGNLVATKGASLMYSTWHDWDSTLVTNRVIDGLSPLQFCVLRNDLHVLPFRLFPVKVTPIFTTYLLATPAKRARSAMEKQGLLDHYGTGQDPGSSAAIAQPELSAEDREHGRSPPHRDPVFSLTGNRRRKHVRIFSQNCRGLKTKDRLQMIVEVSQSVSLLHSHIDIKSNT